VKKNINLLKYGGKNNMYYIVVYDFEIKKVNKALKLFRRYLHWVQNSVFEGELTESQFEKLKQSCKELIDPNNDSVIFYSLSNKQWLNREIYGKDKNQINNFI